MCELSIRRIGDGFVAKVDYFYERNKLFRNFSKKKIKGVGFFVKKKERIGKIYGLNVHIYIF